MIPPIDYLFFFTVFYSTTKCAVFFIKLYLLFVLISFVLLLRMTDFFSQRRKIIIIIAKCKMLSIYRNNGGDFSTCIHLGVGSIKIFIRRIKNSTFSNQFSRVTAKSHEYWKLSREFIQ